MPDSAYFESQRKAGEISVARYDAFADRATGIAMDFGAWLQVEGLAETLHGAMTEHLGAGGYLREDEGGFAWPDAEMFEQDAALLEPELQPYYRGKGEPDLGEELRDAVERLQVESTGMRAAMLEVRARALAAREGAISHELAEFDEILEIAERLLDTVEAGASGDVGWLADEMVPGGASGLVEALFGPDTSRLEKALETSAARRTGLEGLFKELDLRSKQRRFALASRRLSRLTRTWGRRTVDEDWPTRDGFHDIDERAGLPGDEVSAEAVYDRFLTVRAAHETAQIGRAMVQPGGSPLCVDGVLPAVTAMKDDLEAWTRSGARRNAMNSAGFADREAAQIALYRDTERWLEWTVEVYDDRTSSQEPTLDAFHHLTRQDP